MILNNQSNFILRMTILFIGMLVAVSLIFNEVNIPKYFAIIPSFYSFLIFIFPKFTKYIFGYLGLFALNISMFIRYLITPLLISFYGLEKSAILTPTESSLNIAINLMLYELVIIFLLFQFTYKKFYTSQNIYKQNTEISRSFWSCILILISIIIVLIYPEILSRYAFIFNADELKSKKLEIDIISSLPLIVQLGLLTLTITLVNHFYKKYESNETKLYVVLVIATVLITSSFIIGTSRFSVVLPLVTGLYMTFILFKKHWKFIGITSIVIILSVVIMSTSLKSNTLNIKNENSKIENLNDNVQLYFSGVNNVAIAVETKNNFPPYDFNVIISDVTRGIMYINTFFSVERSSLVDFNVSFYNGGPARDQILPLISQGYLYFGFILSPILTIITMLCLMYFDSKIQKEKNLLIKYLYAYVALKFGLFMMANFTILMSFMINNFLILLIIFKLNNIVIRKNYTKKEGLYEYN